MSLRSRLETLERRTRPGEPPVIMVDLPRLPTAVTDFRASGFRAILRDPKGRSRLVTSLREYYLLTALTPKEYPDEPPNQTKPPRKAIRP